MRLRPAPERRRPVNDAEGQFFDEARAAGWDPCKRGWPDFFLTRGEEIACVEVKPDERPLKVDQERVLHALARYGVPCFRWSPAKGFQRIGEAA